ncbi:hypothetical protein EON65_09175 [archaeon]|nr:MAG: hypothetical protein EON65_09175 [archaeon]
MSSVQSAITGIVCPLLGLIIANFMWLSPFPAVHKARLSRNLGSLNPIPFVVVVFNCIGWMIYGCQKRDWFLFWANLPGIILGAFYTITCLTIIAKKTEAEEFSWLYIGLEGLLIFAFFFWGLMGMLSATLFVNYPNPDVHAQALIGTISCVFSICYYGAPLSTMAKVIATRDASSLYLPMILVNLVNALLWTSYGAFALQDPIVWLPNGLGIILAVLQITLVLMLSKDSLMSILLGKTASISSSASAPVTASPIRTSSKKSKKQISTKLGNMYEDVDLEEEVLAGMQSSDEGSFYVTSNPLVK